MNIAILGTRGIPNNYGGFEQCAENLSLEFVKKGHSVTVFNPEDHPFKQDSFNGVNIARVFSNEKKFKFLNLFLYDYLSLKKAESEKYDIVLQLGYAPWPLFIRSGRAKRMNIVTNMDGLDWSRSKWSAIAKWLLLKSETAAVKKSKALVSDNLGIQSYLKEKYDSESVFIPYGADIFSDPDSDVLEKYGLKKQQYYLVVARLEPENNIKMILNGYTKSNTKKPLIVVGPLNHRYADKMCSEFKGVNSIRFFDGIYDYRELSSLRFFSDIYFHGHTVGGTNPSLLEAMASSCLIASHDNIFNRSVLKKSGLFFKSSDDITQILNNPMHQARDAMISENIEEIKKNYSWEKVSDSYLKLFKDILNQ